MSNPDPFARAWRLEKRRKQLGSDHPRCFYCLEGQDEGDIAGLELDHPVTKALDRQFTRVVCHKHHRKLEFQRDVARLTKNGQRNVKESPREQSSRYLLLLAADQESIADMLLSPHAQPEQVAAALRAAAASLRRQAAKV